MDTLNKEVQEHTLNTDSTTKLDKTSHPLSRPTCERRQEQWLLWQDTCGCKNSMPNLGGKTRIIQDYGLNSGKSDLISITRIAIGEVAAIFGETSTVGDQEEADEFDRIATQHITTANTRQFDFYVSGNIPGNQGHFHIIPKEDTKFALSMTISPSLLQKRSNWKGEGQHAKHTCCQRFQNVELQFTTVQTIQEGDSINGRRPEEADMAAVLRASRDILLGESIRYQHFDHAELGENNPECDCCLHIGACQPQEKETLLERMASVPIQSFPETRMPKIGEPVTVYTGDTAQRWKVHNIRKGIGTITIKFEDREMIVDQSWFTCDTNQGPLLLQRLGFFRDIVHKRTTNSIEIWRNILNPGKMMDGEALMVLLEWTIYGCSGKDKLGLPEAHTKTWLVDRSFWQSWEQKNKPKLVTPEKCSNWICVEDEPVWGTEVKHNRLRKLLDTCFSEHQKITHPIGDTPLRQYVLLKHTRPHHALEDVQLMSCDYIQGIEGYYMPLESFLSLRNCERMIAKTKIPIPIHLLDHIIIPIKI